MNNTILIIVVGLLLVGVAFGLLALTDAGFIEAHGVIAVPFIIGTVYILLASVKNEGISVWWNVIAELLLIGGCIAVFLFLGLSWWYLAIIALAMILTMIVTIGFVVADICRLLGVDVAKFFE